MTTLRKAAKAALEAWDTRSGIGQAAEAFEALRAARACIRADRYNLAHSQPDEWVRLASYDEVLEMIDAAIAAQQPEFDASLMHPADKGSDQTPQSEPVAYLCPGGCGCTWRDNHDGSMSLLGRNSKSCGVCEPLPLSKLIPLYAHPQPETVECTTCGAEVVRVPNKFDHPPRSYTPMTDEEPQPVQEPIAEIYNGTLRWHVPHPHYAVDPALLGVGTHYLFLRPPRSYTPMTDEEIHATYDEVAARNEPYMGAVTRRTVVRAIESAVLAKIGIKEGKE